MYECIYVILSGNHNFRRENTETEITTSEFGHFRFIQSHARHPLFEGELHIKKRQICETSPYL